MLKLVIPLQTLIQSCSSFETLTLPTATTSNTMIVCSARWRWVHTTGRVCVSSDAKKGIFPAREMSSGLCRINWVQCRHNITFHNSVYAARRSWARRFIVDMPCLLGANGREINRITDDFMPAHLPLPLSLQVGRRQLSGLSVFAKAS